jgi:hypothetical protein
LCGRLISADLVPEGIAARRHLGLTPISGLNAWLGAAVADTVAWVLRDPELADAAWYHCGTNLA